VKLCRRPFIQNSLPDFPAGGLSAYLEGLNVANSAIFNFVFVSRYCQTVVHVSFFPGLSPLWSLMALY
jgi:hypothetical protein